MSAQEIELEPAAVAERRGREPELQLIDVRESYEHEAGHIAKTVHIELMELTARAGEIEPQRAVVFYCRTGSRSLMAAQAFRASGYEAYSMAGGLLRWVQDGRALSPDGGQVADH